MAERIVRVSFYRLPATFKYLQPSTSMRRGDYERARQAASQFFTSLRAEIDKGDASNLTKAQRDGMQPLFNGRDELIALLARSDPASADRLSDLVVAYRKIMNSR